MHVQIKRAHDRLVEDFEHVQVANDDEQILRRLGPLVAPTRGEIDNDFLEDSRTDLRWDGCVQLGSAVVHDNSAQAAPGRQLCSALQGMGMARACVSEERTIGPISWWRTPTKHANLSEADQPQRKASPSRPTPSDPNHCRHAIEASRRCAHAANPPLPSQRWQANTL